MRTQPLPRTHPARRLTRQIRAAAISDRRDIATRSHPARRGRSKSFIWHLALGIWHSALSKACTRPRFPPNHVDAVLAAGFGLPQTLAGAGEKGGRVVGVVGEVR